MVQGQEKSAISNELIRWFRGPITKSNKGWRRALSPWDPCRFRPATENNLIKSFSRKRSSMRMIDWDLPALENQEVGNSQKIILET